jgi:hypothetical protein
MPSKLVRNPWLSIWTSPRKTIAEIVSTNPSYGFVFLCFIYGFSGILNSTQRVAAGGSSSWGIVLIAAIAGVFLGYLSFTIFSFLITWTGKLCGGKAKYKEVRAAVAWSNVPVIVDLLLWFSLIMFVGTALPSENMAQVSTINEGNAIVVPQSPLLLTIGFLRLALSLWSVVIFISGLSEVQGYSVFKAILNTLLAILVIIAAVFIVFMAVWGIQSFVQK